MIYINYYSEKKDDFIYCFSHFMNDNDACPFDVYEDNKEFIHEIMGSEIDISTRDKCTDMLIEMYRFLYRKNKINQLNIDHVDDL